MMDDLRYFFFLLFFLFFSFFYGGGGVLSSSRWLFGTQLGLGSRSVVGGRAEARGPAGGFAGASSPSPANTARAGPFN